jgi:hypothetical protein
MLYDVIKGFSPMKVIDFFSWIVWLTSYAQWWSIKKGFCERSFANLVEKTLVTFVQLALANCLLSTCTFDL